MIRLAITSMYANPLHPGHIECLELSLNHADEVWVIINNDHQALLKRGSKSFQDEQFRLKIVWALASVSRVFLSIDQDSSVCKTLEMVITEARSLGIYWEIIFTKWWDRFAAEIPEAILLQRLGVRIIDWLWLKTYNSSDIIKKFLNQTDEIELNSKIAWLPAQITQGRYLEVGNRPWGIFYVIENDAAFKVKKLIIYPGLRLSLQSHNHRSEHWVVVSGIATVDLRSPDHKQVEQNTTLGVNEWIFIPQGHLHRLANTHNELLVIIEIQYGTYMGEDDIIRYVDDYGRS
jgi:cytidyltransferase-like protein